MTEITQINRTLEQCEEQIQRYMAQYQVASQALLDIYEGQLWMDAGYPSFEYYVEDRWDMKKAHAYRLTDAARFLRYMDSAGSDLPAPTNERHLRPILAIKFPDKDNDALWQKRLNAWEIVIDKSEGKRITEPHVQSVINRYMRGGDKVRTKKPPTHDAYNRALMTLLRVRDEVDPDVLAQWDIRRDPFFREVREWMNQA